MATTEYICMRLIYDDDLYNQTVWYVQNVFCVWMLLFFCCFYVINFYLYMILVFDLLATKVVDAWCNQDPLRRNCLFQLQTLVLISSLINNNLSFDFFFFFWNTISLLIKNEKSIKISLRFLNKKILVF